MTIIKINAITVPADNGDELARRFAARAGAVDNAPGFEGFELLQPTESTNAPIQTRMAMAMTGRNCRAREASTMAAIRPRICGERAIAIAAICGMRR